MPERTHGEGFVAVRSKIGFIWYGMLCSFAPLVTPF
jgi:hypothetical protein